MVDPRHGPQVRPAPTSWARVRLLKGDSAGGLWDVSSDIPEARIAIGSDAGCGWLVRGSGVAPFHFEVYWDGTVLWVGNSAGAPDVRLDGEPLGDWRPISGRARIEFGRAAMLVEASDAVARASVVPQPRDSQAPFESENTRIAAPRDERREVYASGNSALQEVPPLSELEAKPSRGVHAALGASGDGGATRVVSLAEAEAGRAAPVAAPRVGVGAGVRRVEEPPPISEEATRLGVFAGAGQASALPPGVSAASRAGGGPGGGAVGVALGAPSGAPSPFGPSVAAPSAFDAPGAGAGLRGPVAGAASPFAAPPPVAADPSSIAFARVGEKLKGGLGRPKLSQPPRTWLLLALVVAVLVVFVLDAFDPTPEPPAGSPAVATQPAASPPGTADAGLAAVPALARIGAGLAVGPGGLVAGGMPLAVADAGVAAPSGDTPPGAPVPATPERQAADALIAGRYREALPLYQALAAANPQNPTFSQIVVVLERRVRAACRDGLTPEGTQCEP